MSVLMKTAGETYSLSGTDVIYLSPGESVQLQCSSDGNGDVLTFLILMLFVSYGISCSRGLLISKVTQSVKPNEMGKINGYTTTLDSTAQIAGPIIGTLILSFYEPHWLGIVMSLIALVAFLMVFKKIIPIQLKEMELGMNNST